jgi:hypothetical protein
VTVAVRLLLVVGLLTAHVPVCKVTAAVRSAPTTIKPPLPVPKCNKGCCAGAAKPAPNAPKRDDGKPSKPTCPPDCPCPLCSPPSVLVPAACEVVTDLGTSEELPVGFTVSHAEVFHTPLDRPPRA